MVDNTSYTISYDANGGTDAPANQTRQKHTTVSLSTQTPTRPNYKFQYWVDDDGNRYNPGDYYTADKSVVLTAVWKGKIYTVEFTGRSMSASSYDYALYGDTIVLPDGEHYPFYDSYGNIYDYPFCGWTLSRDTTLDGPEGVQFLPGSLYTVTGPTEFFPVYDVGGKFTVSFDANGGTGAPDRITNNKYEGIRLPSATPVREGYIFMGWARERNASRPEYKPSVIVGGADGDIMLYAVWTSESTAFTVDYDANGGVGTLPQQLKGYDIDLQLPSTVIIVDGDVFFIYRANHVFRGWATSPSATKPDYQPGDYYTENESVTLYAVWEPITAEWRIQWSWCPFYHYNGENGEYVARIGYESFQGSESRSSDDLLQGDISDGRLMSTTENGKTLKELGWWDAWIDALTLWTPPNGGFINYDCDPDPTNPRVAGFWANIDGVDTEISPDTIPTGELTVKPYWVFDTCRVIFFANGGENTPLSQLKYKGTALTLSEQLPTREGYTFLGWGLSADATEAAYHPGDVYTTDDDLRLYALWEENDTTPPVIGNVVVSDVSPTGYTVSCTVSDNKAVTAVRFASWTLKDGQDDLASPWPEGTIDSGTATFRVNVSDHNGENNCEYITQIYAYDAAGNVGTVNQEDYDVLRVFVPPATANVAYDAAGGHHAPADQEKTFGTALTLSTAVPVCEGFAFLGWATNPNAAAAAYQPGDVYTEDADLTLYALWQIVRYENRLTLPAALTEIESEAFEGLPMQEVVLPAGLSAIGDRAFAGCGGLRLVVFDSANVSISETAFVYCDGFVFYGPAYGTVQSYAERNEIPFVAK